MKATDEHGFSRMVKSSQVLRAKDIFFKTRVINQVWFTPSKISSVKIRVHPWLILLCSGYAELRSCDKFVCVNHRAGNHDPGGCIFQVATSQFFVDYQSSGRLGITLHKLFLGMIQLACNH